MSAWLKVLADVFPHLVVPIGPFVAAFRTPIVEVMSYPGVPENLGHLIGRTRHFPWATAGGEVDVATGELFSEPWIVLVRHVVDGVIEVEVVVVHAVHG